MSKPTKAKPKPTQTVEDARELAEIFIQIVDTLQSLPNDAMRLRVINAVQVLFDLG